MNPGRTLVYMRPSGNANNAYRLVSRCSRNEKRSPIAKIETNIPSRVKLNAQRGRGVLVHTGLNGAPNKLRKDSICPFKGSFCSNEADHERDYNARISNGHTTRHRTLTCR